MNTTLKAIFIFAGGVLIGAAGAYKFAKNKCSALASAEIKEAREHYEQMIVATTNEREIMTAQIEELNTALSASHDHIEYQDAEINRLKNGKNLEESIEEGEYSIDILPGDAPHFISIERSGDDGYRVIEYTLYDDQTITNEKDIPLLLSEIEDVLGANNYELMQSGDDEIYCIRNDKLRCDFEITRCTYEYGGE